MPSGGHGGGGGAIEDRAAATYYTGVKKKKKKKKKKTLKRTAHSCDSIWIITLAPRDEKLAPWIPRPFPRITEALHATSQGPSKKTRDIPSNMRRCTFNG
jgi:hypothetical protein